MAYLDWQQNLETGINVIDGQHKRIVEYINQLHDITHSEDCKKQAIKDVIIQLVDYTLSHFAFEESLLIDAEYSDLQNHLKDHLEFSDQILNFKDQANDDKDVSAELLELLKGWLFGHILEDDAQYVSEVKAYLEHVKSKQYKGWLRRRIDKVFGK